MMAGGDPFAQPLARFGHGIGARDSPGAKAQLRRFIENPCLEACHDAGDPLPIGAMGERAIAAEARDLVKDFDGKRAVDGVSLTVPEGSITGILGPNGAGKTTAIRMMLGIIDPSSGTRSLLGHDRPLEIAARRSAICPRSAGSIRPCRRSEAIAFMGALRGLPIKEGRRRAIELLTDRAAMRIGPSGRSVPCRKGMAQTVQLLGTIIHEPRLIVLDEPFAGLDALNQQKLEQLIRDQAAAGVTVIFSTHVIAHAERLCERIVIIAEGKAVFEGAVDEARGRLRPIVHLRTRADDGPWRAALPDIGQAKVGRRVAVRAAGHRPRAAAQGA